MDTQRRCLRRIEGLAANGGSVLMKMSIDLGTINAFLLEACEISSWVR